MALTTNHLVVAITFALLVSAPLSQRARKMLSYFGLPGMAAFALQRMYSGIDLKSELAFYSAFHSDWRNVIIHIFFVPALLWTAMIYMAYVPLPMASRAPSFFGQPLNFAHGLACVYIVFHAACDVVLGTLAGLLWAAMAYTATALVRRELRAGNKAHTPSGKPTASRSSFGTCAAYAGALHVLSWYMQLHPGHAVFEGRKPALIDGMYQSFSVAPLFVFYEGAFAVGYRPELAQTVHEAVAEQHAAWAAA